MQRLKKYIAVFLAVAFICSVAWASVKWQVAFNKYYKPKDGTALKNAKCAVCHVKANGKGALNPYGKALKGKSISDASLKSIEGKDSDKDGASNIKEIRAGTNPGDPKSKP